MGDRRNPAFEDRYWESADGVRLHYRDYGGGAAGRPPVVCLPGLTRNARDYDALARRLTPDWHVIAVNLRGRGGSAAARDPLSYVPGTYVTDVQLLLDELGVRRFVAVGTSLGGIVTMLLAAAGRHRVAGAVLNDIGPAIEPGGLARIRGYVGRNVWHPTWMHAARALAEAHGDVYPRYGIEDWLAMAKRLYRLNSAGRVVLDYDMKIAEPFRVPGNEAAPDLWRTLYHLAGRPVLLVRGARSDILSHATAEQMLLRLGGRAELVTVPDVGHAPTLDEPEVQPGLDRLLSAIAREPTPA
jgi:pimeloyl-ACP methyl ester carboxylesterase